MTRTRRATLGDLAHVFVGAHRFGRSLILPEGTVLDRQARGLTDHEFLLIGASAIENDRLNLSMTEEVTVANPIQFKRYLIKPRDVLLPCRSTSIRSCVVPDGIEGYGIESTVIAIRPHEDLDPFFLAAYLRHKKGREVILRSAPSGGAQMNITVKSIQSLEVPLAPAEVHGHLSELIQAAIEQRQTAIEAADRLHDLAIDVAVTRIFGDDQ